MFVLLLVGSLSGRGEAEPLAYEKGRFGTILSPTIRSWYHKESLYQQQEQQHTLYRVAVLRELERQCRWWHVELLRSKLAWQD